MFSGFSAYLEHWPLARPFRISRGAKTEAVVVVVEARADDYVGRGESVPYARYGQTPESVLRQLEVLSKHGPRELGREGLLELLPPGAARNAADCALWDLEARRTGRSVADILRQDFPPSFTTAVTVSLDDPQKMGEEASRVCDAPLIKVKVDAQPEAAIAAVMRAAPHARLIVDPNESWTFDLLRELQPLLVQSNVAVVEQPLPAKSDGMLEGFVPLVPLCADESVHTMAELEYVRRRYQLINIKLDKTGGLTQALRLRQAARASGLGVMVCTSLGIAPALQLACDADFLDLDGPWWLLNDRPHGVRIERGTLTVDSRLLWGRPESDQHRRAGR
jgi:L-alanine-DL-glutamate epimerase-like enolase superfamily enzyme